MMVTMTKEEIEKLTRIKNRILDMLVISENDAYNFAHTCLTCGLDFVKRKRNEQEILNDFEKLGWFVSIKTKREIILRRNPEKYTGIWIDKLVKEYLSNAYLSMKEHNLLSELLEV